MKFQWYTKNDIYKKLYKKEIINHYKYNNMLSLMHVKEKPFSLCLLKFLEIWN